MKKRIEKGPKETRGAASHADKLACMDYLHGDVVDGEFEAACDYEYGRESNVMREAAKLSVSGISDIEIACKVEEQFQCGHWFIQHPWFFNEEPLFRDEQAYDKSLRAAKRFRAGILPWEYGFYAEEKERQWNEMAGAFFPALKAAQKTSAKSS